MGSEAHRVYPPGTDSGNESSRTSVGGTRLVGGRARSVCHATSRIASRLPAIGFTHHCRHTSLRAYGTEFVAVLPLWQGTQSA
jgi:hypothetical protein